MTIQEKAWYNKQCKNEFEIKFFYLFSGWRHQDTAKKKTHTIVTETVSDGSVRGASDRNWPHQDL